MSFELKYLKYKMKYLTLKNQIGGGCVLQGNKCVATGSTNPNDCFMIKNRCVENRADSDSDCDDPSGPAVCRKNKPKIGGKSRR
jgi:hypothetical protein